MKFVCFGGAAAAVVADNAGEDEAVVACHRSRRRGLSAFRGRFLSGNKGKKSPSAALLMPAGMERSPGREVDVDAVYDMVFGVSSVPSSSALSSSASPDSSCTSSSCSSSLSSSSFLGALPRPAKRPERRSPAAGVAAVVVCLVMMLLCGRVGATLLTSTALCLFPLRWSTRPKEERPVEYNVASPLEYVAASAREEETTKRKVIMEGFFAFLVRNRKK